jgi:hypothetical protein
MALDLTVLANDEVEITAELSATLVFADQSVVGMCGPGREEQELGPEGFTSTRDIEFRALVSRFSARTAPFNNQEFTHRETGKRYRIKSIHPEPTGLAYILTCVDLTR